MGAIAPKGGSIKLNQLVNTPKEFQDKELNVLVTGVDRSSTGDLSAGAANDSNVNDGMTDMILYVHFNNETGELKMLQIPRDTMVTTDRQRLRQLPHQRRRQDPGPRTATARTWPPCVSRSPTMYQLPHRWLYHHPPGNAGCSSSTSFGGVEMYVPAGRWITRPSASAPALSTPATRRWTATALRVPAARPPQVYTGRRHRPPEHAAPVLRRAVPPPQEHRQHLGRRQADPRRAELYGDRASAPPPSSALRSACSRSIPTRS